MMRFHPLLSLLVGLVALWGCSGGGKDKDGSVPTESTVGDGPKLPDGYSAWPCEEPGKSCNAHDPCALDPVCSTDLLCIPNGFQSCNDNLDCTDDVCKGMGLCDNIPKADTCALPVKTGGSDAGAGTTETRCFNKDDSHPNDPCLLCDPETSSTAWSPANGGSCDDGNDCSKDDYCQQGQCKGVYYGDQCADEFGCTDDLCDGKGGCVGNQLKSDWCLINGACYKDQGTHPNGSCFICDVKTSQSDWTAITNTCMIDNKCYNSAAQHPTGTCATCDPAKSTTTWTTSGVGCLIDNVCYKAGDKDTINCSTCDPTKSTTAWTPLSGLCKIDGKCYNQGDKHTGNCAECDTAASATSWTVKGAFCLIANVCKNPGDKDSINCSQCDPNTNKYDWTPLSGMCKIAGACYTDQQKDATGCLMCSYSTSSTSWTPVAGASSTFYGFETGTATGWTLTGSDPAVKWQVSTKRPGSGTYSLYYGDPVAGNYAGSNTNNGTATMPAIQLAAGKKAGLTFSLYMDTEGSTSYDTLKIYVGSTQVWEKDSTQQVTQEKWQTVSINLSSYAGQNVVIKFVFDTEDDIANSSEGVFIDDLTIYHNC